MFNRDITVGIAGKIIKDAIRDYKSKYLKRKRYAIWAEARDFLFRNYYLERFLVIYGLWDCVNCRLLRKKIMSRKYKVAEDD